MAPGAVEYYNFVAPLYDSMYDDEYWQRAFKHIEALLTRYVGDFSEKAVLDIGGGTGRWSIWALERGARVTMLEPAPNMIAVAERKVADLEASGTRLRERFQAFRMKAEEIDVGSPGGVYDVVLLLGDVLSYADEHMKVLRNLRFVSRVGTLVFGTVDNYNTCFRDVLIFGTRSDLRRLEETSRLRVGSEYGTFSARAFRPSEIRGIFTDAGFEEIEIAGLGVFGSAEMNLRYAEHLCEEAEHIVFVARNRH